MPILNGGMITNAVSAMILSESISTKGQVPMGMLDALLYLIPNNNIQIPENISMSYALAQN
jgi:hypothetical protein